MSTGKKTPIYLELIGQISPNKVLLMEPSCDDNEDYNYNNDDDLVYFNPKFNKKKVATGFIFSLVYSIS